MVKNKCGGCFRMFDAEKSTTNLCPECRAEFNRRYYKSNKKRIKAKYMEKTNKLNGR